MKGVLFVSFGTSHEDARMKAIDAIEERVRSTVPNRAFYSAWTSGRIIAKVRSERGEHHDTLEEAFARMSADGIDDLIVVTSNLMHGAEMAKIEKAAYEWAHDHVCSTHVVNPLLDSAEDRAAIARVLCNEFAYVGEDDAVLFMGHGSSFGSNGVYSLMQDELHAQGGNRFFVATVEGEPTFEDAWVLIAACGARRVYLAPLMIVAGDHAKNDMAGDDDDSWANQIRAHGLQAEPVLKGLGEYDGIQQIICDHVEDVLTVREVMLRG